MAAQVQFKGWAQAQDPPKLTNQQWNVSGLLGIVLIVTAILQLISFGDFKDWLDNLGFGAPAVWGAAIVLAELWGSAAFFKVRLSKGFRMISAWLAILASGFWFIENLRLVSEGRAGDLTNSGFFGRYLHQNPGWWTVVEVSILLFWVVYCLNLAKGSWNSNN